MCKRFVPDWIASFEWRPPSQLFGWIAGIGIPYTVYTGAYHTGIPYTIPESKNPVRNGAAADAEAAEAESEDDNTARRKPHPNRGSLEYAHSMVMTACIDIRDHLGTCKQEVVLPPRELGSCKSTQLGCALLQTLEQHLFGTSLEVFVNQVASKFSGLNIVSTGDAASANLKTAELLSTYVKKVAREHGLVATSCFTFCGLHQLSRILSLHLERQALTAAMYSISRLRQHKSTRERTRQHLKTLLTQRFEYKVAVPPFCQFTRRLFRQHLLSLLTGAWNGEEDIDKSLTRAKLVEETLRFFNGDLSKGEAWTHYCHGLGCHDGPKAALEHAPWQQLLVIYWLLINDFQNQVLQFNLECILCDGLSVQVQLRSFL